MPWITSHTTNTLTPEEIQAIRLPKMLDKLETPSLTRLALHITKSNLDSTSPSEAIKLNDPWSNLFNRPITPSRAPLARPKRLLLCSRHFRWNHITRYYIRCTGRFLRAASRLSQIWLYDVHRRRLLGAPSAKKIGDQRC